MTDADSLRKKVAGDLEDLIDYGFAPRLVQAFTKLNYRKIYRWLSCEEGLFLPPLSACEKILTFRNLVNTLRSDFKDVVTSWNGERYHKATKIGLFNFKFLQTLEDKNLSLDEKIRRLVLATFREWAKAKGAA